MIVPNFLNPITNSLKKCPSLLLPNFKELGSNYPTGSSTAKLCCQTHMGKRRHCSPGPWWHLLSMGCLHTRPLSGCPLSGPAFRLHTSQSRLTMCSTRPTHRVVVAVLLYQEEEEVLPVLVHMPHSSKKKMFKHELEPAMSCYFSEQIIRTLTPCSALPVVHFKW